MKKVLFSLMLFMAAPVVSAGTMWTGDDAAPPPPTDPDEGWNVNL